VRASRRGGYAPGSWLLAVLKRLISDHLRHHETQKRGGGQTVISVDALDAEERYALEPADTDDPEHLYARAWARQLLDGVREKLRTSYDATGRAGAFELLLPFLMWDTEPPSHREIAQQLGSTEAASRILKKHFAAAGIDKTVRLRDAHTLELLREFRAHDGPITVLAFHPSKPILATGSADLTIRLWNVDDGRLIEELGPSTKEPTTLHFSPSGNRLISQDSAGVLRVWDLK
jgi:hypothetical protein